MPCLSRIDNCMLKYKKPVQQIVEYQQALFGSSIVTVIPPKTFRNPPYEGVYRWKVRAFKEGRVIDKFEF